MLTVLGDDRIEVSIPVDSYASKILCEAHNSALSPIDGIGVRFFRAVREALLRTNDFPAGHRTFLDGLNGRDVERWFLKFLIGSALKAFPETRESWSPPIHWIRTLFGLSHLRAGCGLAFQPSESPRPIDSGLASYPVFWKHDRHTLSGLRLTIGGIDIDLMLDPRTKNLPTYRPSTLRVTSSANGAESYLLLGWNYPHPAKTFNLTTSASRA